MSAVVLLSGGVDSFLCFARCLDSSAPTALTIDYGQRHRREIEAARKIYRASGVGTNHFVVGFSPTWREVSGGASALLDPSLPIPDAEASQEPVIVPERNRLLVGLAIWLAKTEGLSRVVIGAHADDYAGFPDCRPTWLAEMRAVGEAQGVEVRAPLLSLSKSAIVDEVKARIASPVWSRLGDGRGIRELVSCYSGLSDPCGRCLPCVARVGGGG